MSYEKRNEMERQFISRATDIALSLGSDWQIAIPETDYTPTYATLTRASDGVPIYLALDRYKGRISCRPSVPQSETGGMMSIRNWLWSEAGPTPEATFAFDRPADKIASEIKRKVIDPYAPLHAKILALKADKLAKLGDSQRAVDAIESAMGVASYPKAAIKDGRTATIRRDGCQVEVSAWGSIKIEFSPATPSAALSFIEWWKSNQAS